jgi:hypothetical protein
VDADRVILHDAARRHFARDHLDDDGVLHASENVIHREPLDDEDDPRRWLLLGYDRDVRILELVVLVFDDPARRPPLVIHAMKARPQYLALLR